MTAPQPWLIQPLDAGVLRVPLRIARCPGCSCDPAHPSARSCDRVGCPMKHLGPAHSNAGAA